MASVIVNISALVVFFGGLVWFGVRHNRRHPEARVRNYFDESSWGPQ